MNTKKLESALRTILFEDMSYGVFDRPGPTGESDPEFKPTVPREVPLRPTEMMSTQIATERPPIEDENYRPTTVSDLRSAASAIAGLVPADQVENFYMNLQRLLDDATNEEEDRKAVRSIQVQSEEENPEPEKFTTRPEIKKESTVKKNRALSMTLDQLLSEISRSSPSKMSLDTLLREIGEIPRRGEPSDQALADIEAGRDPISPSRLMRDDEEVPEAPPAERVSSREASLEDIADILGYKSGASGAAQGIQDTLLKVRWLLSGMSTKRYEEIVHDVYNEYIEAIETDNEMNASRGSELFDDDDIEFLRDPDNEELIKGSDSFRYFFDHAILEPAWSDVKSSGSKIIKSELDSYGIPKELQQMTTNIVKGEIKGDTSKLMDRRISAYLSSLPEGSIQRDPDEIKSQIQDFIRDAPGFLKDAKRKSSNDLLAAMRNYVEQTDEKKNAILAQSLAILLRDQNLLNVMDARLTGESLSSSVASLEEPPI